MATDTFLNTVGDGDVTNPLSYDTLAVPTPSDDLVLSASPTNNATTGATQPCNNLTDSSGTLTNPINGAQITVGQTATGIKFNSGQLVGVGQLLASGCIFNADPSASVTGEGNVFSATLAGTITSAVDVTFVAAGVTWTGPMNVTGAVAFTGSATIGFSGGGTLAIQTLPAGVMTISGTAMSLILTGVTVRGTDIWTTVASITGEGNTYLPAAYSITFSDSGTFTGGTYTGAMDCAGDITFGTVTFTGGGSLAPTDNIPATVTISGTAMAVSTNVSSPDAQYVLASQGGTLTLPAVQYVASPATGGPATFGVGGTGSVGTLTLTGAGNVLSTTTPFGIGGNSITGTWQRAANVASDVLMKPHVKIGDLFGPVGNQQTGTYAGSGGGGNVFGGGIGIGV